MTKATTATEGAKSRKWGIKPVRLVRLPLHTFKDSSWAIPCPSVKHDTSLCVHTAAAASGKMIRVSVERSVVCVLLASPS